MRRNNKKTSIKRKNDYSFLVMICLVFLFGMYGLVKTPQKSSVSENRTLSQFTHFTLKNFLNGKFQDSFEKALSDQFAFSEQIRVTYGDTLNNLPVYGIDKVACHNKYVRIKGNKMENVIYDCDDYIIAPPMKMIKKYYNQLNKNIERYNHVNSLVKTYYYYFNEPNVFDFEKDEKVIDMSGILQEKLKGAAGFAELEYSSYDEYRQLFYKTDHHLNHLGQYMAFYEIAKMLGIENPVGQPETVSHHERFFGSRARDSQNYTISDEFVFNNYDLPEYSLLVNRKSGVYEHYEDFLEYNYTYTRNFNFYGWTFGSDSGEVILDFNQPKKENLLIIMNSYGKPMSIPLAQYFNKTYLVDLRHYKDDLKKEFSISDYIKDNKIDKVLFIVSSRFPLDNNSNRGLEN